MQTDVNAKIVFDTACCCGYKPVALASICSPPISGGPLFGFEPVIDKTAMPTVVDGFLTVYHDDDDNEQKRYMKLDEVMGYELNCYSAALARAIAVRDAVAGEFAAKQVKNMELQMDLISRGNL